MPSSPTPKTQMTPSSISISLATSCSQSLSSPSCFGNAGDGGDVMDLVDVRGPRPWRRTGAGRAPNRPPPGSVREYAQPDRAGYTRHRHPPAGYRRIGPGGSGDVRPCGRGSNRTSPPAAPFRQRAVVPHLNPASPRVGLAPGQDWDGRIIPMKPLGRHDVGFDQAKQRASAAQTDPTASAMVESAIGTPSRA